MRAVFRAVSLSLLLSVAIFGAMGIFFFFMPSVWSPPTRQWLEQKISSAFLGPAHIGDLRFTRVWPLTLSFKNLRIEGPALKMVLELEQFDIGLDATWNAVRLSLGARQGSLSLTTSPLVEAAWHMAKEEAAKSPKRTSYPADQLVSQLPLFYDIQLENVALHHEDPRLPFPLRLDGLNAHIHNLDAKRMRVELKSDLALPEKFFGLKMPIQVDLPELNLVEGGVKLPKGHLWIFGVGLEVQGEHVSASDRRHWEATLKPVDLSQLPVLPEFLPAGQWRGPLNAQVRWRAQGDKSYISGGFEAQGIQGQLDMEAHGFKAQGSLKTSAKVVIPETSGEALPQIDFQLDGSALSLGFKDWLKKPASVPLQAFVKAAYESGALTLRPSQFRLGPFVVLGSGRLEPSDHKGGFEIELKKTRLEDAVGMFPVASGYPLSGAISARARVTQGGNGLENLSVQLQNLKIEQVVTEVRWPREGDAWLKGPVQLSIDSKGQWLEGRVASAQGDFSINLNQTEISYPKLLYKKKGWPLRVAGRAGVNGLTYRFSPLQVQLPKGIVNLSGTVGHADPRPLGLTLQVQGVRPQEILSMWQTKPPELTLTGNVDAALTINGEYDSRMGMRSPIKASGNMAFEMTQVSWKPLSKAPSPSKNPPQISSSSSGPLIRGPLLPETPWARQSQFSLRGQMKQLEVGSLRASGVALKGRLNKGTFQGDLSVQKFFEGSAQLRGVQLALLEPQIKTSFLLQAQNLKVSQFLKWILPEYAGRGDGLLSLNGQLNLPMATIPQELSRVAGEISFQLEKGEMDSEWLVGRVVQALKSKGLPLKVAPPSRLRFVSQGQGQIKEGEFHFAQWTLETSERDQVVVKGKVGLDLQADLAGTIYLAQAPIGGAIANANRDGQGRFVLPFVWKGSVLEPNLSIAESAVAALLKKTAEVEAKKFIKEKVEKNLKQSLDRELKKLLGN